jgi:hypothetical protein
MATITVDRNAIPYHQRNEIVPGDPIVNWNLENGKTVSLLRFANELRFAVSDPTGKIEQYLINTSSEKAGCRIEGVIDLLRTSRVGINSDGRPFIVLADGEKVDNFPAMDPADLKIGHFEMYKKGVAVTVLSCAAYTLPFIIAFPFSGFIQIVALGVITAVAYGIINDLFACHQCLEYFTNGHTAFHKRLITSNNPNANAVVWGIHATWILGAIAGVVMAVAARAFKIAALTALNLTPFAGALVIGTCIFANHAAKNEEANWAKPEKQAELAELFNRTIFPAQGYHPVDLRQVPVNMRAAYMGVGKRNEIGYAVMPAGGALITAGIIATRIFLALI